MFVYVITNRVNGKQYVGQTNQSLTARMKGHLADSEYGRSVIARAIAKYGPESFYVQHTALPVGSDQVLLDEMERRLIVELQSLKPSGYNVSYGGSRGKHHPESIEKIRASKVGKPRSPETIAKVRASLLAYHPMRGVPFPEHMKQHLRELFTGQTMSKEQRVKLREAWAKRKAAGFKLPPPTAEHRRKISAAQKGKTVSPALRAQISAKLKGRHLSEETKAKMSASRKGRKHTESWYKAMLGHAVSAETRAKISAKKRERDAARKTVAA